MRGTCAACEEEDDLVEFDDYGLICRECREQFQNKADEFEEEFRQALEFTDADECDG